MTFTELATIATQAKSGEEKLFDFYVFGDSSGDILIGVAANEDGNLAHIKFEHYSNKKRPANTLDLLSWMDG